MRPSVGMATVLTVCVALSDPDFTFVDTAWFGAQSGDP